MNRLLCTQRGILLFVWREKLSVSTFSRRKYATLFYEEKTHPFSRERGIIHCIWKEEPSLLQGGRNPPFGMER